MFYWHGIIVISFHLITSETFLLGLIITELLKLIIAIFKWEKTKADTNTYQLMRT